MDEANIAFIILMGVPVAGMILARCLVWTHHRWMRKVRIDRDFALSQHRIYIRDYVRGSAFVYVGERGGLIRMYPYNWIHTGLKSSIDIVRTL